MIQLKATAQFLNLRHVSQTPSYIPISSTRFRLVWLPLPLESSQPYILSKSTSTGQKCHMALHWLILAVLP